MAERKGWQPLTSARPSLVSPSLHTTVHVSDPQWDLEEPPCPLASTHLPGQWVPGAPWVPGLLGIRAQQKHHLFPGAPPSLEPRGNLQPPKTGVSAMEREKTLSVTGVVHTFQQENTSGNQAKGERSPPWPHSRALPGSPGGPWGPISPCAPGGPLLPCGPTGPRWMAIFWGIPAIPGEPMEPGAPGREKKGRLTHENHFTSFSDLFHFFTH